MIRLGATRTYFHLRKASRAITQLFVETVKLSGLRGTQFSTLVAVTIAGGIDGATILALFPIPSAYLLINRRKKIDQFRVIS